MSSDKWDKQGCADTLCEICRYLFCAPRTKKYSVSLEDPHQHGERPNARNNEPTEAHCHPGFDLFQFVT